MRSERIDQSNTQPDGMRRTGARRILGCRILKRGILGGTAAALLLATSACSDLASTKYLGDFMPGQSGPQPGQQGYVKGFLGGVVADEPNAALAGRNVLSAGGTAADAAAAMGMMLAVTLPSRAGLGGGGACIVYDPDKDSINKGVPEALLFLPPSGGATGERPAAVPLMARGLFALAARYGRLPFEQAVIPAEQAARFGVPVSRAFARDIAVVAGPLGGDPVARSIFLAPGGGPLAEGAMLRQPELAATLGQMRMSGVGDFYSGALARQMVQAANIAGGGLTLEAMRKALPVLSPVLTLPGPRGDQIAFLPPPADGGLAAAAAFKALQANPDDLASAQSRALAVAAAWRHGDTDVQALLDGPAPAAPALGHLPATTAFMALDKDGRFVGCAVSMNNLFGTGRVAPGTGVLLAASPASAPPPLLSVAMGYNANIHAFHGAATGTGQEGAPVAAAATIRQVLATRLPATPGISGANSTFDDRSVPYAASNPYASTRLTPAPDPGRANALSCSGYLPDDEGSCGWSVDPRGAGLAVGSN